MIRFGKVSMYDEATGMMRVTYPELDGTVSCLLPVLSFGDEYKLPKIGDEVAVLHLDTGAASGIVLGKYWNKKNTPAASGSDKFRKELGHVPGEAYIEYVDGGDITFKSPKGTLTLEQIKEVLDFLPYMRALYDWWYGGEGDHG